MKILIQLRQEIVNNPPRFLLILVGTITAVLLFAGAISIAWHGIDQYQRDPQRYGADSALFDAAMCVAWCGCFSAMILTYCTEKDATAALPKKAPLFHKTYR